MQGRHVGLLAKPDCLRKLRPDHEDPGHSCGRSKFQKPAPASVQRSMAGMDVLYTKSIRIIMGRREGKRRRGDHLGWKVDRAESELV